MMTHMMEVSEVKVNVMQMTHLTNFCKKLAGWGLPTVLVAGWFIYPALTDNFKVTIGIQSPPPSGQVFEYEKADVGEVPELTAGKAR
ncbi:hypothetical protein M885DRAFT_545410 [Pelagophyceae sp. CCMP2097]|nr:hypothetical protein M885DRAFT_545410 [Pelagophyceae sp. CCMP2097]